jgi:hypothetical protein
MPIQANVVMGTIEAFVGFIWLLTGVALQEWPLAVLGGMWSMWSSVELPLVYSYAYGSKLATSWPQVPQLNNTLNMPPPIEDMVNTRMLIHFFIVVKGLILASAAFGLGVYTFIRNQERPMPAPPVVPVPGRRVQ